MFHWSASFKDVVLAQYGLLQSSVFQSSHHPNILHRKLTCLNILIYFI